MEGIDDSKLKGRKLQNVYPVGYVFGKLRVVGGDIYQGQHRLYPVKCECGNYRYIRATLLQKQETCGECPPPPPPPKPRFKANACVLTIDGETKSASEWLEHPDCNISRQLLSLRLKKGWEPKRAVFSPVGK
jgi:hypothetical protein